MLRLITCVITHTKTSFSQLFPFLFSLMPRTYMTIYSIWIMLGWHSDRFSFLFAFMALFWCFVSAMRISHLVFLSPEETLVLKGKERRG
ncbi:hypothetical protein BKA65DRAFT_300583 [Rhexocercosporidium sp. MPI-PUGE-AT-0058]|nr:hypothetical protein BKA65DRAFT_300583 [Rhexocercosporidium sp. MPI-PUGE-AT-0058]